MKIIVELNDASLQNAVEAQVSKAIAEFTEGVIQAKVQEIVDKKLDRVTLADISASMVKAADLRIDAALGASPNDWSRKQAVRNVVSEAAERAIKASMK